MYVIKGSKNIHKFKISSMEESLYCESIYLPVKPVLSGHHNDM